MTINENIKNILCWSQIRERLIIRKHKKTARFCLELIREYEMLHLSDLPVVAKKDLCGKRIIWQYWGQGLEGADIPELVRICLRSVEKYCGEDYNIIRLTDENISEYIEFPDYVLSKRNSFPVASFSDLLRTCLLSLYGGCWLDATVLLTGSIPERYWRYDFFMFQRDEHEPYKDYWKNAFAYYYGWKPGYKVRVLNSIFFVKKDSAVVRDLCGILLLFWKKSMVLPDYFLFQILFNELVNYKYKDLNCPLESDCLPHYVQQMMNDEKFNIATFEETLRLTCIHKLSYKGEDSCGRLSRLLESNGLQP